MKPVLSIAKWVAAVALLAWWIVSLTSDRRTSESITNPLVRERADPHVFRSNGAYYFTATVPEYDRIVLRRAPTLADLATAAETVIWRKPASGEMAGHIRAPEIHRIDGKWYVYFSAGSGSDVWALRLYVLENASADPTQGTWIEKGQFRTDFDTFALDATTFAHDGARYFVWAQRPPEPGADDTHLYMARMKNPWTIEGPQVSLSSPTLEWETGGGLKANEAPAVIEREGRIFITYSAGAPDANYCLGMLSARADSDLLKASSWTKSPRPVFATSEKNKQYGPGHNAFLLTTDGRTDLMLYHAHEYSETRGGRRNDSFQHARVQPFTWKPDGTPDFGEPLADGPTSLTR